VKLAALAPVLLAGCRPEPLAVVEELRAALERGERAQVERRIHPQYSDPLGGRAELLGALDTLGPLRIRFDQLEAIRGPSLLVIGRQELTLEEEPSWTLIGPLRLELAPDGGLEIRSGLLEDLRDIRDLFGRRRAALEANDAVAFAALLHPGYRDGDIDRPAAVARLEHDLAGIPVRLDPLSYWVEVRGLEAHADERYRLTVQERPPQAAIGRFTLRRSNGRWLISGGLYPARPP
jgi:hypothetical protein